MIAARLRTSTSTVSTSSARLYSSQTSPHPSKPPRQGQPLHATHTYLVGSGELTPEIKASEYEERRKKLMASLPDGAVVVCMGGTVRLVSQRKSYDCYWIKVSLTDLEQRSCKSSQSSISLQY